MRLYYSILVVTSILMLWVASEAQALVDYSEDTSEAPKRSFAPSGGSSSSPSGPSSGGTSTALFGKSSGTRKAGRPMIFAFSPSYEVITVEGEDKEHKVKATQFNARVYSPWNFYLDMSYAMYSTQSQALSSESGSQKGNPEFKVGIDWLDFGGPEDRTTLTFIAGASLAASDSTLGSSRTDKMVGLETAKRFYWFGLGLGYELRMTGNPEAEDEMEIGDIHHLYAGLDFDLSQDINVSVMADNYTVGSASGSGRANHLERKLSFASVGPSLTLKPGSFSVELGARFRTKRVDSPESLASARLWNLPGAYGNTIFTGVGLSF